MYLISAYFDENTNKILKHLQQRIADKTGNDFMIRNNVMPHLTLSSIEARNVDVLIPTFEKVCREKLQPLEEKGIVNVNNTINIVSVGQLFPRVTLPQPRSRALRTSYFRTTEPNKTCRFRRTSQGSATS